MALTQDTVLSFLLERGGQAKNSELLNNFQSKINCSDPAEKQHNRDLFKKIVNSVAVVKQMDDAKFVVVKKRYQDFVRGGFVRVDAQKADLDDGVGSRTASSSPSSLRRGSGKMLHPDIENNNVHYSSNINNNNFSDNTTKHIPVHSDVDGYYPPSGHRGVPLLSSNVNSGGTTVKVLNITGDPSVKAGKTGAVFAVIAVKSPPRSPRESVLVRRAGFDSKGQQKAPEKPNALVITTVPSPSQPAVDVYCPGSEDLRTSPWSRPPREQGEERQAQNSPQDTRTSHWSSRPPREQGEERPAPSSPLDARTSPWSRPPREQGEERPAPSSPQDTRTSPWSRPPREQGEERQAQNSPQDARTSHWSRPSRELGEERPAPSSPQLRKTQHKSTRQQGDDAKYSESSFPLEPTAHEWLVKSASGLWGQIYGLLLRDTQLAQKKDFMSGFTAVHWAAKGGNSEMVRKIMNVSKKRGIGLAHVDVDSKAHGGYTPLHIAAIHGQEEVMFLLVQGYGAKVNVRDNHGKKPCHYLDKGASDKVRELLGGPQLSQQDRVAGEDYREIVPKGLNTISRLFPSHIGHRKKHRHQQPGVSFAGED